MYIALITDLSGISRFYRYIPEIANTPKNAVERYELGFNPDDIAALFDQEFAQPVDEICDALVDRGGDIDYLNAEQCRLLAPWLEEKLKQVPPHPLDTFYPKLLEFAKRQWNSRPGW